MQHFQQSSLALSRSLRKRYVEGENSPRRLRPLVTDFGLSADAPMSSLSLFHMGFICMCRRVLPSHRGPVVRVLLVGGGVSRRGG